jgi:uncharacterized membrane protein
VPLFRTQRPTNKDEYLSALRAELRDDSFSLPADVDRVESFLIEIDESFEAAQRRSQDDLTIIHRLGSPRRLAQSFKALSVVRSRRPTFTVGTRFIQILKSAKHQLMSNPGRGSLTLLFALVLSAVAGFGWFIVAGVFAAVLAGLFLLFFQLHVSPSLEVAALLFLLGLFIFNMLALNSCRRSTLFASGLLWGLFRRSATKGLEAITGEER